jgi:hypothetical protein
MKVVIEKHALGVSPETYLASVRMALGSNSRLCELIPGNHSEETIRRFLAEVERRLAIMVHKPA